MEVQSKFYKRRSFTKGDSLKQTKFVCFTNRVCKTAEDLEQSSKILIKLTVLFWTFFLRFAELLNVLQTEFVKPYKLRLFGPLVTLGSL